MSVQPSLSYAESGHIEPAHSPIMTILPLLFLVLWGLAFLAGVPLNGYVLFVTGCRMQRTASTVWFMNRAVSDFIFILCLPVRLISIFPHLDGARKPSSHITSLHMFSSAFLLTAISIDRCILVTRPEWAQKCRTPCLAFWEGLVTWALSVGFSLRYDDLFESILLPASPSMYFGIDKDNRTMQAIVIQFLVGFLIPLALNLIPTLYIVLAARRRRNRLLQSTQPLKILLGLIPTFFIFWLPYHVFFFLWISARLHPYSLASDSTFPYFLMYFNCCLNPIFYLTMEEEFLKHRQRARNPHVTDHSGPEPAE
ncbi:chemerin-like receptor 1 [Pelodiscus sinensis]|uniref:chemerin-like receptor 1 n=1 Tax=Pelodiscus sinensis TaxID=13735 RepID=UPI003F6B313D